jgi:hypothetical protein
LTCCDIKTGPKKRQAKQQFLTELLHIYTSSPDGALIYTREGWGAVLNSKFFDLPCMLADRIQSPVLNAERSDIAISHGFNPHGAD